MEAWLDALARELERGGVSVSGWLLGTARVLPSVILIPVLGLRALPGVARLIAALALAACTAPGLAGLQAPGESWLAALLTQIAIGLPPAASAASTLWVASMAGNLLDQLAEQRHRPRAFDMADTALSPLGVLLWLAAAVAFFSLGGPARLAAALAAAPTPSEAALRDVVTGLLQGIRVAVLLAAPLVVLVAFFALLQGLWVRVASPASVAHWYGPGRMLVLIAVVALLLDRLVEALALWMTARLPPG